MALSWLRIAMVAVGGMSAFPLSSFAVTIEQGSGANAAAIQAAVDAFRTTLGSPDNLNAPGPLGSGRREINWDGGGATSGTAAVTPFTVFQNTRGATFTTPGIGLTQTPVTGVAVTMMATMKVLQRARANGQNLIITHEPTFFDDPDKAETVPQGEQDPVLAEKRRVVKEYRCVMSPYH